MTGPVLSPVRWWRDDTTRYQARPPFVAPAPIAERFARIEYVAPLLFDRLEPVTLTTEQDAELRRHLLAARDAGWRPEDIKPVLILGTLTGRPPEDEV